SAIVILSDRGKQALMSWPVMSGCRTPVYAIPCSVDFSEFKPDLQRKQRVRASLGIPADALVLGYAGSLGSWYMLPEMLAFFAHLRARQPQSRFLILTPDSPDDVFRAAEQHGIPTHAILIRSAARAEVADLLSAADAGLSF